MTNINYHVCHGTYSLNAISESYKHSVLKKYPDDHWVHKTFKHLQTNSANDIHKLFADLDKNDQIRDQNWRTIYPEFLDWYAEYTQ